MKTVRLLGMEKSKSGEEKKYISKPVSHMAYTGRMFIDCEGCMADRGGKPASLKGKGRQMLRNLK